MKNRFIKDGFEYEEHGQYVTSGGQVCFLDFINSKGLFAVHDGECNWTTKELFESDCTSGKITEVVNHE